MVAEYRNRRRRSPPQWRERGKTLRHCWKGCPYKARKRGVPGSGWERTGYGREREIGPGRVKNRSGRRADGKLEAVGDVAARLVEGRSNGVDWEKSFGLKLGENDAGTIGEVIAVNTIEFGEPLVVARERDSAFGIAPTGGFV